MVTFKTPLDARALDDGDRWVLTKDLIVDVGANDGKDLITVPVGFITDFGSVPRLAQIFVNPQGKAKPAYILHDWLYRIQERSQLVADACLHEAMESLGVSWLQRVLVYRGLRLGGFVAYNDYTKKRKQALIEGRPYPYLMEIKS